MLMTPTTKKNFNVHDDVDIKIIENLDIINEYFDLQLKNNGKRYYGPCPIHGGDNPNGFSIFIKEPYSGYWVCWTHKCHLNYNRRSALSFVLAAITSKENINQQEAIEELEKCLGKKLNNNKNAVKSYSSLLKNIKQLDRNIVDNTTEETFDKNIIKDLEFPPKYLIKKGISEEVLLRYEVGACKNKFSQMNNMIIFPIYDDDNQDIVGFMGRTMYDLCKTCKRFHDRYISCNDAKYNHHPKWKAFGLVNGKSYLYNMWFAKSFIQESHSICIVESIGNVLKLVEAGINNSVAILGTNITAQHLKKIYSLGVLMANIIMDNDAAGQQASRYIHNIFSSSINTNLIKIPDKYGDVCDMPVCDIQTYIKPQIQQYFL